MTYYAAAGKVLRIVLDVVDLPGEPESIAVPTITDGTTSPTLTYLGGQQCYDHRDSQWRIVLAYSSSANLETGGGPWTVSASAGFVTTALGYSAPAISSQAVTIAAAARAPGGTSSGFGFVGTPTSGIVKGGWTGPETAWLYALRFGSVSPGGGTGEAPYNVAPIDVRDGVWGYADILARIANYAANAGAALNTDMALLATWNPASLGSFAGHIDADLEHYRGAYDPGGDGTNAVWWSSSHPTTYSVWDGDPTALADDVSAGYGAQIRAWYMQAVMATWPSAKVSMWGGSAWGHWEDSLIAATPNVSTQLATFDTMTAHRASTLGEMCNAGACCVIVHEGRYSGVTEGPTFWRNCIRLVAFAERLGRWDVTDASRPLYVDAWYHTQAGAIASDDFPGEVRTAAIAEGVDAITLSGIINDSGDRDDVQARLGSGGVWELAEPSSPASPGTSPMMRLMLSRRRRRRRLAE